MVTVLVYLMNSTLNFLLGILALIFLLNNLNYMKIWSLIFPLVFLMLQMLGYKIPKIWYMILRWELFFQGEDLWPKILRTKFLKISKTSQIISWKTFFLFRWFWFINITIKGLSLNLLSLWYYFWWLFPHMNYTFHTISFFNNINVLVILNFWMLWLYNYHCWTPLLIPAYKLIPEI
jgi:hypothetical protein